MLEIRHLNKYFGDNHVLKDINLEIESKKTTAIMVPPVLANRRCYGA